MVPALLSGKATFLRCSASRSHALPSPQIRIAGTTGLGSMEGLSARHIFSSNSNSKQQRRRAREDESSI